MIFLAHKNVHPPLNPFEVRLPVELDFIESEDEEEEEEMEGEFGREDGLSDSEDEEMD